jgi:hypothetical protein
MLLTHENIFDLGRTDAGEGQTVACLLASDRCIPDKNASGRSAVVSCALELISLLYVVLSRVRTCV